jgi:type I restriction enzyme M protein
LQFEEFAPVLNWWNAREESPNAWKVDFAAKHADALKLATPHWRNAEAERSAALALSKPMRALEQEIAAVTSNQKSELQDRLRALKVRQQAHEQAAKSAQNDGDAVYWPIYNLDMKSPHAKAGLKHADPKDLIASMRGHEVEVMRLLSEIEALVNEVEA